MRLTFSAALLLAFATAAPGAAPASPGYHIAGQIPGPDGGWDLVSIDPAAQRLYVARADGVMAA